LATIRKSVSFYTRPLAPEKAEFILPLSPPKNGIHPITAIASSIVENLAFYVILWVSGL
jgi:hypothetical protein